MISDDFGPIQDGSRKISKIAIAAGVAAIIGTAGAMLSINSLKAGTALNTPKATAIQAMPIPARPINIADVIEKVSPAVVTVTTTHSVGPQLSSGNAAPFEKFFERFFDDDARKRFHDEFNRPGGRQMPQRHTQGIGSGFIIDKAGYIVTNNHVIAKADKITVTLDGGKKLDAKLVGADEKTDLALLKVETSSDLPMVRFGQSERMRVGDWVITMGNPFGIGKTATTGIVSARHRNIGAGPFDDFLQIDAPINRGNSGGPAFNLKGEVIGVNTAIFSPSGGNVGIGFAIPSKIAKKIVAELREDGSIKRGWLGVHIQAISNELAESLGLEEAEGALVSKVTKDSPAAKAGLKQGDVIIGVDGEDVDQLRDLPIIIAGIKAGHVAEIEIWRNGRKKSIDVTIGAAPKSDQVASVPEGVQGMALAALDDQ